METISYRTGGITAAEAKKSGLVFVQRTPGSCSNWFTACFLTSCFVAGLRITFQVLFSSDAANVPALLVGWGVLTVISSVVVLSHLMRDELWLSRGQIYCARRITRGRLRPVMSAQTVNKVDIVVIWPPGQRDRSSFSYPTYVIEIAGAEGIIHFGQKMDEINMARTVQQIRDWIQKERGWDLPAIFDENEIQEAREDCRKSLGARNSQMWQGLDLVEHNVMNQAWSKRRMALYGTKPREGFGVFQKCGENSQFELPEVVRKAISTVALVLFVSLSVSWILGTFAMVTLAILNGNLLWLLLSMPFIFASAVFGWILWIWMGDVITRTRGTDRPVISAESGWSIQRKRFI